MLGLFMGFLLKDGFKSVQAALLPCAIPRLRATLEHEFIPTHTHKHTHTIAPRPPAYTHTHTPDRVHS